MKRFEFTIEELSCYTITIEVESQDDDDLETDAAWEKFQEIEGEWFDHPTRFDQDGGLDVQIYGPFDEGEQTETEWRAEQ